MHTPRPSRVLSLLAALAALFLARPLPAQPLSEPDTSPLSAEAQLSQSRVFLGDETLLQVTVSGASAADRPRIDAPDGLAIEYLNEREQSGSFTSIVNGRVSTRTEQNYIFQFRVRALRPGSYTIPPITVRAASTDLRTDPIDLTVIEPSTADDDRLELSTERADVWLGEVVRVRVRWLISSDVGAPSFESSQIDRALAILPSTSVPTGGGEIYRFSIAGRDIVGVLEDASLDGRPVRALSFDLLLKPVAEGDLTVGPLRVVYDRRVGSRRTRALCTSEPLTLRVRPLPTQGRPAGFTGLVGRYSLDASATPTTLNVGDPIALTVRVLGTEPMSDVNSGPDLSASPGFDAFRLSPDGWRPDPVGSLGVRSFETTIRALSPDAAEIPAIELPFFDPDAGVYRTAKSQPIPLEVRAVREVTSADAVGIPAPARAAPGERTGPLLWAEPDVATLTRPGPPTLAQLATSPAYLAAIAAPPIAVLTALTLAAARRRRDPDAVRRARLLARASSLLSSNDTASAARAAVAAATGVEADAVTAADARSPALPPEAAEPLAAALRAAETGSPPPSADACRAAILALRRTRPAAPTNNAAEVPA